MGADPAEPAADARANYDYADGAVERPALVADLEDLIDGDVRFDRYTRELYATDASAYEVTPIGVVFPTSTGDVAAVVEYCAAREIPVLPRGGGTSLAGQAVNEAVVLDFTRYMTDVLRVDPTARTARAEAGVYLDTLNEAVETYGLKFAPDPAWRDKSTLGGAIGNNSTGAHSLVYGKTDAYIEECTVVLADGTVETFGDVSLADLEATADPDGDRMARIAAELHRIVTEEADEIRERYPDLKRNVSGYNLDRLVAEAAEGRVNLGRVLAGSEGTLAIVTEARVSLEPVPETKAIGLLCYPDLQAAMADVEPVLAHDPAAVEVMDDVLLDLARETAEFGGIVDRLPPGTDAVLLVEFYGEDDDDRRRAVADLIADREGETATLTVPPGRVRTDAPKRAIAAMAAYDEADRDAFWKLRKSGLPILLGRTSDEKHISFIEDCAVPPEALPAYVADFQAILEAHDTTASFYAHAGPGVLHVRPLIDTKTVEGIEQMASIADAVTDLIVEYDGAVSGEHGDGRARSQWNEKRYGSDLLAVFRDLKTAFDPQWLLNPGQVCGDVSLTENLRFDPDYEFDAGIDPALQWENENGFQGMVELCHGCGGCRGPQDTTGGVMCPTYRASREEITSTRGRANLLRQAMSGDLPADEHLDVEFMHEVMDLCIGCKGCARDCPSEVDMAKLKAEIAHAHHHAHGASLRDRLFANIAGLSAAGSALAPASNWLVRLPGARRVLEHALGIARDAPLPTFHRENFRAWLDEREPRRAPEDATRTVLLVADPYTDYVHPGTGRAAVRVLETADVHVALAPVTDTGRPAYSKGFIDVARDRARTAIDALAPRVAAGWDVVCLEPSDAVMLQSDYADLLAGEDVRTVMTGAYGFSEYLDRYDLLDGVGFAHTTERLTYHGHCHQKARATAGHAPNVLSAAGYRVTALDSGCCGMAGSFGYEAEHRSMSEAIARILFDQVDAADGDAVVAPGASCRSQLGTRYDEVVHPAEKLDWALG